MAPPLNVATLRSGHFGRSGDLADVATLDPPSNVVTLRVATLDSPLEVATLRNHAWNVATLKKWLLSKCLFDFEWPLGFTVKCGHFEEWSLWLYR